MERALSKDAALAGTIDLGDLTVSRLGFGAMRLRGFSLGKAKGSRARRQGSAAGGRTRRDLHRHRRQYGPATNELLISAALYPYPPGLVIATKGGLVRPGRRSWVPDGRPDHLGRAVRQLGTPAARTHRCVQFHAPDPNCLLNRWKRWRTYSAWAIRHIGISNVTVAQLELARSITPIVSVQNMYNLRDQTSRDVLAACERLGIAFLPWYPLGGKRGLKAQRIKQVAARTGLSHAALSLAWLLTRSPVILPIPGTRSIDHLEENVSAGAVRLGPGDMEELA